ncbi:STAS domain-containing protein [Iodobacter fluviatilis]|uniref:Phospholipid transport system transporter-binding protein n=1 Tax=Iodobacter fluviatilis TaxID=537 RepID=A0A377SXA1_9NEIS|nr:STAS domain-containing protein [Iodobacter fluviatilis]TCU85606.1 phospholipid transport system transporter-binding protein [Iodobacter fluviatilis]STR44946.1 Predicted NTP binding protein (contains STAS domain) [Iodobacter fluviatilis]
MKTFQPNGVLTLESASRQLATLPSLGQGEQLNVDLSQITAADSSAVALLLHWMRTAQKQGAELQFSGVPEGLAGLIRLYEVDILLPLSKQI